MRGRTGTRGIQQLPLNVFNAAVEARKRSVGRSHRSAPRRPRWGWNRVGRPERPALASCSSWTSVSLYTYREVSPSPGRLSIHGYPYFAVFQALTAQEATTALELVNVRRKERQENGTRNRQLEVHPVASHLVDSRKKRASEPGLFESSHLTDGSPSPACVSFHFRDDTGSDLLDRRYSESDIGTAHEILCMDSVFISSALFF